MKKLLLLSVLLLSACTSSEKPAEDPRAELERLLNKAGIELPENWDNLSRQERGIFLIQNGLLDVGMSEE